VILKRTDTESTKGVTATYTGKITADNKISGTVTWSLGLRHLMRQERGTAL
jgi:hypothetical protein